MFRASCVISAMLTACLAGYGQQATASIGSIESLIRSQRYNEALQLAKSGLRDKPGDFRLWTLEGIVFSIQGNDTGALASFDKALHLSPGYPAALKGEVDVLYKSQDKRAIPLLRKLAKTDPQDETAEEMLGILERNEGDCRTAIDDFHLSVDAIQAHPDSLEAYGDCLLHMNRPEQAVPVFERLSLLLPQSDYPKYDLAIVLVASKRYEAALELLNPLLTPNSSDPDVLSLASEAYEATGNTPQAVSWLRQAIVLDPANPSYYVAFAALCLNHNSFQVGIDMIDAGLLHIHGDPSLYISRGLLYAQVAEYDKAEADFNAAEQLDSAQSLSSYALDLAEMQRNHSDKALLKIRSQLQDHPDSPWLHYVLAKLLDDRTTSADAKPPQEAIQSALQAVKLKPDFVQARNLLAGMYMHSGQYEAAIEQCHLTLKADPSNESAIYHLIMALRRSGQDNHKDDIQSLSKRLSDLQQSSLHKETEKNRYQLVEQNTAPAK